MPDLYTPTLTIDGYGIGEATLTIARTDGNDCPELSFVYKNRTPLNLLGCTDFRIYPEPVFDSYYGFYPPCELRITAATPRPGRELQLLQMRLSQDAELRFLGGDWVDARSEYAIQVALNAAYGTGVVGVRVWFLDGGSQGTVIVFSFGASGPHEMIEVEVQGVTSPDFNVSLLRLQSGDAEVADEFQIVVTDAASYTLTVNGTETSSLAQGSNINPDIIPAIQTALGGTSGDVIVYGLAVAGSFMPRHIYVVRFAGNYSGVDVPQMTISDGTVATVQDGGDMEPL